MLCLIPFVLISVILYLVGREVLMAPPKEGIGRTRRDEARPVDEAIGRGPFVVFDDWEGVTGYDPAVRIRMMEWTKRNGHRIAETHMLLASKILSMGVSLATRPRRSR